MKIFLGPFRSWVGPFQLADQLQKVGVSEDRCHAIGEWLADTWVLSVCQWIDSKRKRKVKVHIDNYDVWNLDATLAYVILPALIKLKEQQHGAPFTEDSDVPEELRSYNAPPKENEYDTDDLHFKRWDWVLDEIIWTFSQIHPDNNWEDLYHTGEIDMQFNPIKFDDKGEPSLFEMVNGPKDTHTFDKEGYKKHSDRIQNGLRLFGFYYSGLWD